MSSDAIKDELVRLHPDTVAAKWKRRSRTKAPEGVVRTFEYEDGRMVDTLERFDGGVTATNIANARLDFDRAILDAFRQPLMDRERYGSWDDMMEDYGFEHAGKVLSTAMIACAGPTPARFYREVPETGGVSLHADLCGLERVRYVEHEGRPAYEMMVDRSGYAPTIRVFQTADGFDFAVVDDVA